MTPTNDKGHTVTHRIGITLLATIATAAGASATALPAYASTHHHHHRRHHHHAPAIPQHNGGDRDGDNNGAPSDGDGNA